MPTPTLERPAVRSLAQILTQLGVGPDRVYSLGRPATTDDLFQLKTTRPTQRFELVSEYLLEKPMGSRESYLGFMLAGYLWAYNQVHNLGVFGLPDNLMQLQPGLVYLPDLSFTSWNRLPNAVAHLQRVAMYGPDLAVEILSPSNTAEEMARKTRDYFSAGTQLVWIVDPDTQTIAVYAQPESPTILGLNDTLEGGVVLPGFTLVLADFFRLPQLNPRS